MRNLKVLFVCIGNICRSPMAEAIFRNAVKKAGEASNWEIDSAGLINRHVGDPPDWRVLITLKNHGIQFKNTARQIVDEDFETFDFIFGMDNMNIKDLEERAPKNCRAKIFLLGDFGLDESDKIIKDPYFDRTNTGFEKCYQQCTIACEAFLKAVNENRV